MWDVLDMECPFLILESQSMIYFSSSLLPRSFAKRPMRLRPMRLRPMRLRPMRLRLDFERLDHIPKQLALFTGICASAQGCRV